MNSESLGWKEIIVPTATILVTALVAVMISTPATSSFVVAAVFPPWWSAADVREAVDPLGATSSTGRTPNVVTVYGGADLQSRLRKAGAWLILDPRVLACGPRSELSR